MHFDCVCVCLKCLCCFSFACLFCVCLCECISENAIKRNGNGISHRCVYQETVRENDTYTTSLDG